MPDYNLGRAHGEIVITSDVRDGVRGLNDYERATTSATDATKKQSVVEQEATRRRDEATKAAVRRKEAEQAYKRVMDDTNSSVEEQVRVEQERSKAISDHLQLSKKAIEAERAYRAELTGNTEAVKKFVATLNSSKSASENAASGLSKFRREADDAERTIKRVSGTLTSFIGILAKVAAVGAGGLIAGGAGGLLGAGGAQALISTLGAATAIVTQFSGALALLPALAGAAGVSVAALTIGTKGFGDALKNMDDPKKFAESIKDMSPAMKEATLAIASFRDIFRGAQQQISQSLFAPIVKDIEPLIRNLLPLFVTGLKAVADAFGQAAHQFATWLQLPGTLKGISEFINNVASGLKSLLPAIKPFSDALLTLSVVGSTFFTQLGGSITNAANSLNNMVQNAAADGSLQRWIQGAITGFQQAWQIIKNVGIAIKNIFDIFGGSGNNILSTITQITAEFKAWTESVGGQNSLAAFFKSIHDASVNLMPIIKSIGGSIGIIISTLVNLGNAISPGITKFFNDFQSALKELAPNIVASAPALNTFLGVMGDLVKIIIDRLGDKLPTFLGAFADASKNLTGPVGDLASALGFLLENLSPQAITAIAGAVVVFQTLAKVIPIISAAMTVLNVVMAANPFVLAAVAIAALVAGIIYAYTHFDTFKGYVDGLWSKMKEVASWIGTAFVNAWHSLVDTIQTTWASVTSAVSSAVDQVISTFKSLPAQALQWGKDLVSQFAQGLLDSIPGLRQAVDFVAGLIPDSWEQHSPAKRGPLSETSTQEMGEGLGQQYAEGITRSGKAVTNATDSVAGGAAQSFESAGVSGTSGKAGKSGFEQWVNGITSELGMWGSFFQHAFEVAKNIGDIFVQGTKIVASLWNGGDNPLTREGGIAGPPAPVKQQGDVGGFQPAPAPGKAPLPDLAPATGQGLPAQVDSLPGGTPGGDPGSPGWFPPKPEAKAGGDVGVPQGTPPPNATTTPPSAGGGQAGPGPVAVNAEGFSQHQRDIAGKIISEGRKRGMTDAQIQAALATAGNESNFGDNDVFNTSGGNASVGGVGGVYQQAPKYYGGKDNVMNPDIAIPAFLDRYKDALGNGWDPLQAATHVQNPQLGVNNQDTDYYNASQVQMDRAAALLNGAQPAPSASLGGSEVAYTGADGVQYGRDGRPVTPVPGGPGIAAVSGKKDNVADITIPLDPVGLRNNEVPALGGGPGAQAERSGRRQGDAGAQASPFTPVPYGLPSGTDTGGYGTGNADTFPPWLIALGQTFGVKPSTYAGHQESNRDEAGYAPNPQDQNRGVDWVGTPEQMQKFAEALVNYGGAEGKNGGLEQVIYQAGIGGQKYGLGGAGNVDPGYYPQSTYDEHGGGTDNLHVHTRFNASLPPDLGTGQVPQGIVGQNQGPGNKTPVPVVVQDAPGSIFGSGGELPPNIQGTYDPNKPLVGPNAGLPPNIQGTYDPRKPLVGGAIAPTALAPKPGLGNTLGPDAPDSGTISGVGGQKAQNTASPLDQFSSGMQSAANIASDAFQVFNDVLVNIDATASILTTLNRGFENTEDVNKTIDQIQTFVTTAADVAKLVSSTTGMAASLAAAGGADPTGGGSAASGALSAVSAISGLVSSALTTTNAVIDLGQEAYHIIGKYGAQFAGIMLGNSDTGALGGNVRMLLNTHTGQLQAYSQDNPDQKATHNLAPWLARAYGGNRPDTNIQQTQLNLYTGPGSSPQNLISDTMWLVNTGAPQSVSVAGAD